MKKNSVRWLVLPALALVDSGCSSSASGLLVAHGPPTGTWRLDVVGCDGVDGAREWSPDDLFYHTVLVGKDGLRVAIRVDGPGRHRPTTRLAVENLTNPNARWATFGEAQGMVSPAGSDWSYRCQILSGDSHVLDIADDAGARFSGQLRVSCSSPSGSSLQGSFVFNNCPESK